MIGIAIKEDGLISNSYFNIKIDGNTREDAILTTKGINEAIKYASENNINYIKLEKGKYIIDVVDNEITLMSNIELDLNGSTLNVLSNSEPRYNLIHIIDAQNVKVKNGMLLGDRETHDYTNQSPSTHEWGHGIKIEQAKDIEISDLDISLMTGDGIDINDTMVEDKMRTENIVITRNNIHHVRRNGISVGAVDTLDITHNTIHDISGTNPQSGIDIERNNTNQFYKNVTISNNKIYNHKNGSSIAFFDTAENFKIIDNDLSDRITASRYSRRDRDYTFPYLPIEEIMEQYNITITGNKVIDESLLDKETFTATATEENVNVLNMRTSQIFVTGVQINKTTLELEEANTETLTATTIPTNADYRAVTWSSSNKNVATITLNSGKITAKSPGTTTITVTTKDGEKTATCEVTVKKKTLQDIPVSGINLNKQQMELVEGEEENLIATVVPENATNKNIIWSSADEKIAKVENGIVRGISAGTTTITAKAEDGAYESTCEVVIKERTINVTGIILNKKQINLIEGNTEELIATITPFNATNQNIKWTTSDGNVATVANGMVTGVSKGKTTITAETQDGEYKATCEVIVEEKIIDVTGISLNKTKIELVEGTTITLTPTVTPENATNKNVIWNSSDDTIAKVENGIITGISKGITTIKVLTEDEKYMAECKVTVLEKKQEEQEQQQQQQQNQENNQQQDDLKDQENKQQEQNSQTPSSDKNSKQDDTIQKNNKTNEKNEQASNNNEKKNNLNEGISNNKDVKNENKTTYQNNNTQNSSTTTSTAINGKETTAKTILPKTGANEEIIIIAITIFFILSIIFGVKIKKYKGI